MFFAIGWAVVAARRGEDDGHETESVDSASRQDSELHTNPLEFLVTSRFSDWLPALLMEPAEALARIVSVLPSQQVGELMARLPMSAQIDVLQLAAISSLLASRCAATSDGRLFGAPDRATTIFPRPSSPA